MSQPTIRKGSDGWAVRQMQAMIDVAVDGAFGPMTEAALMAYQGRMGLAADGICGPRTWQAMGYLQGATIVGPTPFRYHLGRRPNLIRSVEGIVLHYTATPWDPDGDSGEDRARIIRWLTRPTRESSTHFVVLRSGEIMQGAPLYDRTWHAPFKSRGRFSNFLKIGDSAQISPNLHTIAVDLESAGWLKYEGGELMDSYGQRWRGNEPFLDEDGDPWEQPQAAQVAALANLLEQLGERFPRLAMNLADRVVSHQEINQGSRVDPGPAVPMEWARVQVQRGARR